MKQSPSSSRCAFIVAILSSLLLVFSLITLAAKASSIQLLKDDLAGDGIPILNAEFPESPIELAPYPQKLATNAPWLVLITACFCLILATVLVTCTVKGIRQKKSIKVTAAPNVFQGRIEVNIFL
jgi:hypothetical protein